MPIWTFVDYVEASGRNPFADWMAGDIPPDAKTAINVRFLQMVAMERWPDKWVSSYEGYVGIFEARLTHNKVQYRPLFMSSADVRRQMVLLAGAIEKGGKLKPKSAPGAAANRRNTVLQEPNRVTRHRFS